MSGNWLFHSIAVRYSLKPETPPAEKTEEKGEG